MKLCTQYNNTKAGQSLIELLFAMTIASVVVGTLAYMLFTVQIAVQYEVNKSYASAMSQEGIAAVGIIAQNSYDTISPGVYGLQLSDGVWSFSGSSDTFGVYTRTATLTEISDDTMEITSEVIWESARSGNNSVIHTTYVSNWRQNSGRAAEVLVDTNASYSPDGTIMDSMSITNTDPSTPATLTELVFQWDGLAGLLAVDITGVNVYSRSSTSPALSGDLLDITDVILQPGEAALDFGPVTFDADVSGGDVHISLVLSDGSIRYVRITP